MVVPNTSLNPFFQVAFVHGHLTAQFLNGDGVADMLQQDIPRLVNTKPAAFVCQEFAAEPFFFFVYQAFEAVQQYLVHLGVEENIFQCA